MAAKNASLQLVIVVGRLVQEDGSGEDWTATTNTLPLEAVAAVAGRCAAIIRRVACKRFADIAVARRWVERKKSRWWDRLVVSAIAPLDGAIHSHHGFHRGIYIAGHHIVGDWRKELCGFQEAGLPML